MKTGARRHTPLLIAVCLLAGCAAQQIGGPTAPAGAIDAGLLTLPSGRSYPVYPRELTYTGSASYRWPDGRTYEGQFQAGQAQGIGLGTWPDGDRYRGLWQAGKKHGHGELTRADGSRFLGDFVAGRREGDGVEQSAEGLYRGRWANDLPNGHGEFHGTDGAAYEGQWYDGRRHGAGSYVDQRGNHYEGDWHNDVPDGFGTMRNTNGSVYEGEWRASRQSGYGTMTTDAGVIYEGTWIDGQRQGFGLARRPDGSSYEGGWRQNQRNGQGIERVSHGSYHDGVWEADQPNGPGVRKDRTGIKMSGTWDADQLSAGRMQLPSGAEYAGELLGRHNTVVADGLLAWLETLAADGDPWAHFFLGTAYTDFTTPTPDSFKATGHFRYAARAGIPDGQFRLALLLLDRSPGQAIDWLQRAAGADQAQANTLLGEYHLVGLHVPADLALAVAYFRAGSDAGDMTARNNLAWILATTRDPALRDGAAALALIRPLALLEGHWQQLETLAAAQAALGEYQQARETQQHAIDEASRLLGAESQEVKLMLGRLEAYRANTTQPPPAPDGAGQAPL